MARLVFLFVFALLSFPAFAQPEPVPVLAGADSSVSALPVRDSVTFCLGPLENPEVVFRFGCGYGYCDHVTADAEGRATLDVSCLPAGVYEVEIRYDGKVKRVLLPVAGEAAKCMRMMVELYPLKEELRELNK